MMINNNTFLKEQVCHFFKRKGFGPGVTFRNDKDYKYYLRLLKKYKKRFHIHVFAFCLLPDSVWFVLHPLYPQNLDAFINEISHSYEIYYQSKYSVSSRTWQKRYHHIILDKDEDLFDCIKYIEFLPVKEQLSLVPTSYSWSSCGYRVENNKTSLLDTELISSKAPPSNNPPQKEGKSSPSLIKGDEGGFVKKENVNLDPVKKKVSYLPYNRELILKARKNRSNPTPVEQKMWQEVLKKKSLLTYKFLRQRVISEYIVDFYCFKLFLAIELDGESHLKQVEYDQERSRVLGKLGIKVIRYWNGDVMNNIEGVYADLVQQISKRVKELNLNPLTPPYKGGSKSK